MNVAALVERLRKVPPRELAAPVSAIGCTALLLVGMLRRLPLSIDFTDESFSTALAYRFALGDRPFIDEINSAQTAALILTPFVWAFIKLTHSTAGILLFTRLLFVVFRLALAATVFATLKRYASWPLALVTSLVCLVFVPGSIPNIGYNVLGSGFLAMGAFVAVRRFGGARDRSALFWAGVCNGLATLAYPPLLVPAAILGIVVLLLSKKEVLREFGEFVAGGAVVVASVAPLLFMAGARNLRVMVEFGTTLAPKAPSKLFDLVLAIWAHSPVSVWVLPALGVVIAALKIRPAWALWVLPLFVSALALAFPAGMLSQFSVVIYAGLFAPLFLVVLWDQPFCRALFFVVWVPSAIAGLVTAYTSSNGEINAAIGLFPGSILFVVYEALAVERLAREAGTEGVVDARVSPLMQLGPAILIFSMLARYSFSVYRDGAVQELTVAVTSGPFRGLYTTPEHAAMSAEVESIFQKYARPDAKVLAYWDFPAAYLFTKMRPAGNTVWMTPVADQGALVTYYRGLINGAGFSMKLKSSAKGATPLDHFLESSGRELEATPSFLLVGEPAPAPR